MTRLISTALLAFAIAASASPAPAQDSNDGAPSASIRRADLDLSSAEGIATFRGRVKAAANRVCGITPLRPFNEADAVSACRTAMLRSGERHLASSLAAAAIQQDARGTR